MAKPDPLNPRYTKERHHEFNTDEEYENATKLFYPAIEDSDIIIVWAPDGIGTHTHRDIGHALSLKKRVVVIHSDGVYEARGGARGR